MQVFFPDIDGPDLIDGEKLEFMLAMLGIEGLENATARRFSLVLAQLEAPFKYVGKLLQLRAANGSNMALAREAYGRFVVGVHGETAADLLAKQVDWLALEAQSIESNNSYTAVVLFEPNRADFRLALVPIGARLTDIEFVCESVSESGFVLTPRDSYLSEIGGALFDRVNAIETVRREVGGDFQGLPA